MNSHICTRIYGTNRSRANSPVSIDIAAAAVANESITPAHDRAWGGQDNMKICTLAATAGVVALAVLSAVTAHGAETRLRS